MHGVTSFCAALVLAPARVLDAGYGTGRVALSLKAPVTRQVPSTSTSPCSQPTPSSNDTRRP